MTKQLDANEMAIHQVFSSDHRFSIPDYQRPYSWEEEQALQLLEDLDEAIARGGTDPYFLGSLVLIKKPDAVEADVVDGQQRLTTLTILLAVLRHLAESQGIRGSIEKMIMEPGDDLRDLASMPRLRLRPRDAEFFAEYVQASDGLEALTEMKKDDGQLSNDSRRSIRLNALALNQELATWDDDHREALAKYLTNNTFLVVVTTPSLDSAHRIFSVMNARGLDLEPSDIFKADVIGKVSAERRTDYATKWEEAEESLGRRGFSELFLHIRMIHAKVRARRELLREFPEQVLSRYDDTPTTFVDEVLVPYAEAFAVIEEGNYSGTSPDEQAAVNAWFMRLRQIDNNDWRPAALWALRHHDDDPVWLAHFLKQLERLAASMFIRRSYNTPRVARYAEVLKDLEAGHGVDSPSLELTQAEQEDTLRRLNGEVYLVSKTRRYVLERLDEALAVVPGGSYAHRIVTVEHVLPQNPASVSPWRDLFTDEERDFWVHRLANLVLLNKAKNASAGNKPFEEKKDKYFNSKSGGISNFALTVQVLSTSEWTPEVLAARQTHHLETLAEVWDLAVRSDRK